MNNSQSQPTHYHLKVLRASPPSTNDDNQLILSNSFGTIYQGETFNGIIKKQFPNAKLNIELEQPNQIKNVILSSTLSQPQEQLIINHHIQQTGLHSLICTLTYNHESENEEELKSFRKLYKFHVLNPIALKTKIYRHPNNHQQHHLLLDSLKKTLIESDLTHPIIHPDQQQKDHYPNYIEIQLQNLASKPLINLTLIHSSFTQINPSKSNDILQPGDIQQYLFKLSNDELPEEIEIRWNSLMAEPGRLIRSIPLHPSPGTPTPSAITFDHYALHALSKPNTFFRIQIINLPLTPTTLGLPFTVQLRLSSVPQAQSPEFQQTLNLILRSRLTHLQLYNANPNLLLLSPQPLQPCSSLPCSPDEQLFNLEFLPLSLPQPPHSPLLLGHLSTSLPHLDILFGFSSDPQTPSSLGTVLVHKA